MKTVAECGIIEILAFSRQLKLHGALPDIIRGNQASQNLETELCRISSSFPKNNPLCSPSRK